MAGATQLHVAMFPFLAYGHLIPFLDLAKLLALKGHRVSFISTPGNLRRLRSPALPPLVEFISFPLPRHHNLPENMESTNDTTPDKISYLTLAYDALQRPLSEFLRTTAPDWIIYDFAPYWIPGIAARHGVSCAFFCAFPSYSIAYFGPTSLSVDVVDPRCDSPENFAVPPEWVPFPTKVVYRLHECRWVMGFLQESSGAIPGRFRMGSAIRGCDAFLVRGTDELESHWFDVLRKLHRRDVIPVGLMPVSKEHRGDNLSPEMEGWLNEKEPGSVVYVAFGSEKTPGRSEVVELARGLEMSGSPFFWVLRHQSSELPDGFEERVRGRGMVWRGWSPQLRILGHRSVGGFLTHCGLSSVKEALLFGLPLIMLPVGGDEPLTARIMSEEMKVGVEIDRDEEDGSFVGESVAGSVRSVMGVEAGKGYREKAAEMKKIYGDEELQEKYTDRLVEYLRRRRHPGNVGKSHQLIGLLDKQSPAAYS